ncbi:MAG: SPFH domain-containing protein [Clostridium sp.]|jgi:membrane protease subunit (stomatin/prohibitin family)|nr:SPFH domain-containing protein [Clostridium sp.]
MGLIRAATGAIGGVLADQWREFFYCDSLSDDILAVKGRKKAAGGRSRSGNKGAENTISNGSVIAVNEGQCVMVVEQGEVVEFCGEAGEFLYDASTEPSLFFGPLGIGVEKTFRAVGKRFAFGGDTGKDQRVYYFNLKEIMGNRFGTASPIPFRIVDRNIGLDVDLAIRCNGEYSFRIVDPLLFYQNVCGNVADSYLRSQMAGQLKAELLTAMQPALAKISNLGVRYSAVPAHTRELAAALNGELSGKWGEIRGIEMVSLSINSINASEEDEKMIKELQRTAALRNTGMAAATLAQAQAEAMKAAASNPSAGPMVAFAGMNMASVAGGMDAGRLYEMETRKPQGYGMGGQGADGQGTAGQDAFSQDPAGQGASVSQWSCACGKNGNQGRFCEECGRPQSGRTGWICVCGASNRGKFCTQCGARKPEGALLYRCDKCGWEPEDPAHPPKFCPECGDLFDERDRKK